MSPEKAKAVIKNECYIFDPLNLDRTTMVNEALDVALLYIDKNVFLTAKVLCSKVHSLSLTLLKFWGFEGLLSAQQHAIPGPIVHWETRNYSEVPLPPAPPQMTSGMPWCKPVLPEALDT